jgi:hypothetical protein
MSPTLAPNPEATMPPTSNVAGGISPLITVPSTRHAKINFVASRINLPKLRKKRRSFLAGCFLIILQSSSPCQYSI